MFDLTTIFSYLKDLSPVGALVLGVVLIVALVIRHIEFRKLRREATDIDEIKERTEKFEIMLMAHVKQAEEMSDFFQAAVKDDQISLSKVVQELVKLNANMSGERVTPENARLVVEYQWNWCRDRTAAVIVNSIRNNNILGNEQRVYRKVLRAWTKISRDGIEALKRYENLGYPYEPLLNSHVKHIWSHTWTNAVPVYHRDVDDFEPAVQDLLDQVKEAFDQTFIDYCTFVEDVDRGTLYRDETRNSGEFVFDQNRTPEDVDMVDALKNYKVHSGTSVHSLDALRAKIRKEETDLHTSTTPHEADEDELREHSDTVDLPPSDVIPNDSDPLEQD